MVALNLWRESTPKNSLLHDVWDLMDGFPARYSDEFPNQKFMPACDIEENQNHYVLSFDMPGISQDDIQIEIEGNRLVVSGERKREESSESKGVRRTERSYGQFQRSFSLPEGVSEEDIQAEHVDGVLKVYVAKVEKEKPKKIKISTSKKGFLQKFSGPKAVNS